MTRLRGQSGAGDRAAHGFAGTCAEREEGDAGEGKGQMISSSELDSVDFIDSEVVDL